MASMFKDFVLLILQFLEEENYKETVHKLEKESRVFFNMRYFEDIVTEGKWEEVEDYLKGFTEFDANNVSVKTFFEIRKTKYLEALDKGDHARAVEILQGDLKELSPFNEDIYKQLAELLTLSDFRGNKQLSRHPDAKTARAELRHRLKNLIEANPLIRDKLQFPTVTKTRLRTLINQSLRLQHQHCKIPRLIPDIRTLFVDHSCDHGVYSSIGGLVPFQGSWMPNPWSVPNQAISMGPMGLPPPNNAADYQTADSGIVLYRARPRHFAVPEENLAELKDEESSLLKERRSLKREQAALKTNLERQRATNEKLKRKIDVKPSHGSTSAPEESISCQHQDESTPHPHNNGTSQHSSKSNAQSNQNADAASVSKFILPDLNIAFDEPGYDGIS